MRVWMCVRVIKERVRVCVFGVCVRACVSTKLKEEFILPPSSPCLTHTGTESASMNKVVVALVHSLLAVAQFAVSRPFHHPHRSQLVSQFGLHRHSDQQVWAET